QNNTINGNWFRNGSVALTHHTAAPVKTIFTNNLITNVAQIQVGQSDGFRFEHNTIKDLTDYFAIASGSTNAVVQNNIIIGNTAPLALMTPYGSCSNCTVSFNLFEDPGSATGTSNLIGMPTFVGGASPSMWAEWQLTSSSLGYHAASDGLDMGATYYGSMSS